MKLEGFNVAPKTGFDCISGVKRLRQDSNDLQIPSSFTPRIVLCHSWYALYIPLGTFYPPFLKKIQRAPWFYPKLLHQALTNFR